MTVTSAMKGLAATVNTMLTETILNGNWDNYGGKIETLGLVSGNDPRLNYVGIPMGRHPVVRQLHVTITRLSSRICSTARSPSTTTSPRPLPISPPPSPSPILGNIK